MNNSVLIAGDFAPIRGRKAETEKKIDFSEGVKELFKSVDLSIVNLECPLTTANDTYKIIKDGPNMKCDKSQIGLLKELNVGLVTLANNHIWDFGQKGLEDTIETCNENNIDVMGAGLSLSDAQQIYYFNINEKRISIINFAENEWASANQEHGGANPLDLIDNLKLIEEAKANSDYTMVIIHGGHENFSYPSPRMVKQYRFFIERGADIVINHHQHCVNGYEEYLNKPIFYGLGNFVFPLETKSKKWYYGLLLKIQFIHEIRFEVFPYRQMLEKDGNFKIVLLEGVKKQKYLEELSILSSIIKNEKMLMQKWREYIDLNKRRILYLGFPLGRFGKLLYKLNIYNKIIDKKFYVYLSNQIRCEAHYDVMNQLLKDQIVPK